MILDFFKNSANLKNVSRQGWIDKLSMDNPESVADHSYSMAIMSMVISDLENLDTEKILKMVLLHDLAESKIGDYTPEQLNKDEKKILENNAFKKLVEDLPNSVKKQYLEIWEDYQKEISDESLLVHQIDRLEMVLQAKIYQKEGKPEEKIKPFLESARKDITDPKLIKLFTKIVQEM